MPADTVACAPAASAPTAALPTLLVPRKKVTVVAGAPELDVMDSRTSATRALTGMVTLFPVAGLNVYVADAASVPNVDALCSRPSTWIVWVRVAHAGSGFSF